MRTIKMFGLAIVTALAVIVVVGASSASAGAIVCKLGGGAQGACPFGYESFTGTITSLGLGKDVFTTSFVTVKCSATMQGSISTQGSTTTNAKGSISSVTWSACENSLGCTNTTATPSGLPWAVEVLGGSLHMVFLASFSMECFKIGKVTCIYASSSITPSFENHTAGMPNAMITANKLALTKEVGSSGVCSSTGTWSALHELDPAGLSVFSI